MSKPQYFKIEISQTQTGCEINGEWKASEVFICTNIAKMMLHDDDLFNAFSKAVHFAEDRKMKLDAEADEVAEKLKSMFGTING